MLNNQSSHAFGYRLGLTKAALGLPSDPVERRGTLGALGGAGLGALSGVLSDTEENKSQLKKILRRALIGGIAGGYLGAAGMRLPFESKLKKAHVVGSKSGMQKRAVAPITRLALQELLRSTGLGAAIGGVSGGLYGAVRGKRKGEGRLGAMLRSGLTGAGVGAGLAGGLGGGLMASEQGRKVLATMRRRANMLSGLRGRLSPEALSAVSARSWGPTRSVLSKLMDPTVASPYAFPLAMGAGGAGASGLGQLMAAMTAPSDTEE